MDCTRCDATGFLNTAQIPANVWEAFLVLGSIGVVLDWIDQNVGHDVTVCDCCGNGENWYGTPGEHDARPHPTNSGVPECI